MSQRERIQKRRDTEHSTSTNICTIRSYLKSKIRTNILQAIVDYRSSMPLTVPQYYNFRAILIGEIIFRNAQRSGVACGIMISEVDAAKQQGETMRITIYNHKTGKIKPAVIFFENLAGKALSNFRSVILSKMGLLDPEIDKNLFLSTNGNKLTHAGVKSALTSCLKNTGGMTSRMTSTQSRIAAATYMATNKPKNSQILADFMQHQPNTAEKYYRQLGGGEHLIEAFKELGDLEEDNTSSINDDGIS